MSDVFDALVGQPDAAAALRHHARRPVHAYLLSGPTGADLASAARALAAALQCEEHGCGRCDRCRRVLDLRDPDVTLVARSGIAWRIEELREAERVGRRRPLGAGRQVVVLEDIERALDAATPATPALLKTLEEPPRRTVFILTAHDLPPELDTIVSRCVEVRLRALRPEEVAAALVADGASPEEARSAAEAAGGDLRRARVLRRDPDVGARLATWREAPRELNGTPAAAARVAERWHASLDEALAPLVALQAEELARREAAARDAGGRLTGRREIEEAHRREQRRYRVEEIRAGLEALARVYRDRLREALDDERGADRARAALAALDAIAAAGERVTTSMNESLLLYDLALALRSP